MDIVTKRMDSALLKRFEKAGLRSLGSGIESGSDKILKELRKGSTRKTYIEANRILAASNIAPQYGAIQALPYETREDAAETFTLVVQLIRDNPNATVVLNKLLPTPNTPIFRGVRAQRSGAAQDIGRMGAVLRCRLEE